MRKRKKERRGDERRREEKRKREIYIATCQHMSREDLYKHCMQRWLHAPLLMHYSDSTNTRSIEMKRRMGLGLGSLGCLYKTQSFVEGKIFKSVRGDTKLREA